MKVYKDAQMKIFSPYIISKNVLEKEFTTGISYFPVSIKVIYGNIVNMMLKIIEHPIYVTLSYVRHSMFSFQEDKLSKYQ